MSDSKLIYEKIDELEIKLAFQDDLLNSLNDIVTRQDKDILNLWAANRLLKQNMNELKNDNIETNNEEAPPPHY
ncbi:MAG: SlyX protein [Pseudohongiellaceae bacterium]|jgi:SlyX protein